jgi:hypothetical protein
MTMLLAQALSDAKDILTIRDVTIIGVLAATNIILGFVVRYLYIRLNKLQDERLEDHREFTKEVLGITDKTTNAVQQVNEILRLTKDQRTNV